MGEKKGKPNRAKSITKTKNIIKNRIFQKKKNINRLTVI